MVYKPLKINQKKIITENLINRKGLYISKLFSWHKNQAEALNKIENN